MFHQFHGFRQISHTHRAITPHPHPYPPTIWLRKIGFFFCNYILSQALMAWILKENSYYAQNGFKGPSIVTLP